MAIGPKPLCKTTAAATAAASYYSICKAETQSTTIYL